MNVLIKHYIINSPGKINELKDIYMKKLLIIQARKTISWNKIKDTEVKMRKPNKYIPGFWEENEKEDKIFEKIMAGFSRWAATHK